MKKLDWYTSLPPHAVQLFIQRFHEQYFDSGIVLTNTREACLSFYDDHGPLIDTIRIVVDLAEPLEGEMKVILGRVLVQVQDDVILYLKDLN